MEFLAVLVLGLGVGAAYAIEAQGIVLIYRASRVVNFAQTGFALVGAYVTYEFNASGVPIGLAALLGALAAGVAGLLVYVLVLRWLMRATDLVRLVAILGTLMVFQSAIELIFGTDAREPPSVLPHGVWHIGEQAVGKDRIVMLIIGAGLTLLLPLLLGHTRFGLYTRAVAEDDIAFNGLAKSSDAVCATNWFLGGALGGVAGALLSSIVGLSVPQISTLLLPAIAAALVGRFQSFVATFVAALAIGGAAAEVTRYLSSTGLSDAIPLLITVVALLLRSNGRLERGESLGRLPEVGNGRIRIAAVALLIPAVVVASIVQPQWANAIATTAGTALIMLSVVVITGFAGQLSLAQLTIGGVAALIAGKLSADAGLPFIAVLIVATLCVVPVGIVLGIPAFRSRGANVAIATLALSFVVEQAILSNPSVTGGYAGTMVKPPSLFGFSVSPLIHPNRYAVLTVVMLFFGCLLVGVLRRAGIGRRWLAVRVNERAASAMGVNVFVSKILALGTAAAFAAVGGVLIAFRGPVVLFSGYNTSASIQAVVLTVIGGVGFISGAISGALIASGGLLAFTIATYAGWSYDVLSLIAGAVVIGNTLVAPSGIFADTVAKWWRLMNRLGWTRQRVPAPMAEDDATGASSASSASVLDATSISVKFGGVAALTNVSLSVRTGEVVGLIGPNGAGKSTLVDVLTGFTKPGQGSVTVDGADIGRLSSTRRARIGLSRTFQSLELFDDMTLRDNLRVAVDAHNRLGSRVRNKNSVSPACAHALRRFGLEKYLDETAASMPLALRQLSGVARAIAFSPRFLLLDEPAAGLDPPDRRQLSLLIRELATKYNIGILLIEHDVALVMSSCDRVLALDFGNEIASGTPAEVRSSDRLLEAYLGSSGDWDDAISAEAVQ